MSRTNSTRNDDKIHHMNSDSRSMHSPSPSTFLHAVNPSSLVNSSSLSAFSQGAPSFASFPPIGYTDIPNYLLNPTYLAMDVLSSALMHHANQVGPPTLFPPISLMRPPLGSPGLALHGAPSHLLLPSPSFSPGFDRAPSAENRETPTPTAYKPRPRKKTTSEASAGSTSTTSELDPGHCVSNETKAHQRRYSPGGEPIMPSYLSKSSADYNNEDANDLPLSLVTRSFVENAQTLDAKNENPYAPFDAPTSYSDEGKATSGLLVPERLASSVSPVCSECSYPDRPATGHSTVESIEASDGRSIAHTHSDVDVSYGQTRPAIVLPPRKRLLRTADEDIVAGAFKGAATYDLPTEQTALKESLSMVLLDTPAPAAETINEDSPQSSNFRSCWKKFSAKASNIPGPANLHHRLFYGSSNKPSSFLQKMAAAAAGRDARSLFMARGGRYFHHLQKGSFSAGSNRKEGRQVPDGSTSPRVTRSQAKQRQKKGDPAPENKEPKEENADQDESQSSATLSAASVRKSTRKKTNNSKYDGPDLLKRSKNKLKIKVAGSSNEGEEAACADQSNVLSSSLDDPKDSENSSDRKLSSATTIFEGSCDNVNEGVPKIQLSQEDVTHIVFGTDDLPKEKLGVPECDQKSNISSSEFSISSTDNLGDAAAGQIALPPKLRKKNSKSKTDLKSAKGVELALPAQPDSLLVCSVKMERLPDSNNSIALTNPTNLTPLITTEDKLTDQLKPLSIKKATKNIFEEMKSLKEANDEAIQNIENKKAKSKLSKVKDASIHSLSPLEAEASDADACKPLKVSKEPGLKTDEKIRVVSTNVQHEGEKAPKNIIRLFFKESQPDPNIEAPVKSEPSISLRIELNKMRRNSSEAEDRDGAIKKKRAASRKKNLDKKIEGLLSAAVATQAAYLPDRASGKKEVCEVGRREERVKKEVCEGGKERVKKEVCEGGKERVKEDAKESEGGECDLVMACTSEGEEHVAVNRLPALVKQEEKLTIKLADGRRMPKARKSRKIDRTGFPKSPKKKKKKLGVRALADGYEVGGNSLAEKKVVDIYEYDAAAEFEERAPLMLRPHVKPTCKSLDVKSETATKDNEKQKKVGKQSKPVEPLSVVIGPVANAVNSVRPEKRKNEATPVKTNKKVKMSGAQVSASFDASPPFRPQPITPKLFQPQLLNMFSPPPQLSPTYNSDPFSPVPNDDRRIPASIRTQNWLTNMTGGNLSREEDRADVLSSPDGRKILSPIRVKFKLKKSGNEWVSVNDKNLASVEKTIKKSRKKKTKKKQSQKEDVYSPYVPAYIAAGMYCTNEDLLDVFFEGDRNQILFEDFFDPVKPNWLKNQQKLSAENSIRPVCRNPEHFQPDSDENYVLVSPSKICFPPTEIETSLLNLHLSNRQRDSRNRTNTNAKANFGNWFQSVKTQAREQPVTRDAVSNSYSAQTGVVSMPDVLELHAPTETLVKQSLDDPARFSNAQSAGNHAGNRRSSDLMFCDGSQNFGLEGAALDLLFWEDVQVEVNDLDEFWKPMINLMSPLCAS